jgi:hypothetical protein
MSRARRPLDVLPAFPITCCSWSLVAALLRSSTVNVTRDPDARSARVDHTGLAAKRVIVGAVTGCLAAVVAIARGASWSVAALCASDVAALVFVIWVWVSI